MKTPPAVHTATPAKEASIVSTMVLAFSADPAARWVWPEPEAYLEHFPKFVRAFGGNAFQTGTAHFVDGPAGAALWLTPETGPDEDALGTLLEQTAPDGIKRDLFAVFEQMSESHPREPHWHLPLIGVDGHFQNRGYGSALLKHALAICDCRRLPAYLESSNPRNIPLYERHGFERMRTIQVGSSPPIVPMVRRPQ
jgi:ribosomal protein S18 acetylase RimI-like enzyme